MLKIGSIILALAFVVLGGQQLYRSACDQRTSLYSFFNSDTLTCAAFYEDTFVDGYPFQCFYFPTTTVVFPDFAIYCLARTITGATAPAMVLSTCLLFALQLSGCYFVMRLLTPPENRWSQTSILLGMGASFLLVNAECGLINPFFRLPLILTYHGGSFVCVVYGLALVLYLVQAPEWEKRPHRLALAALFVDSALGMASDRSILMHLVIPVTVTLVATRLIAGGSDAGIPFKKVGMLAATMASGAMSGQQVLRIFVTPWQDIINHYPYTFENVWNSLCVLARKWKIRLRVGDKLHWLTILTISAAAVVFAAYSIRRLRSRTSLKLSATGRGILIYSTYYLTMSATCLGAICYSGIIYNPPIKINFDWGGGARYFLPVLFMPLFLIGLWLVPLCGRAARVIPGVAVAGVFALAATHLYQSARVPRADDQSVWNYYPPLVAQVDAIADAYGLEYGLAAYWEAKQITLLSRRDLRLHQVIAHGLANSKMVSFHWLNNSRCYFDPPRGKRKPPRYQFILVNERHGITTATRAQLIERFGEPAAEIPCAPFCVFIYNRPSDAAFQNIAGADCYFLRSRFQCRLGESIRFDASALPGEIFGTDPPDERMAIEGCVRAGAMNYGPWLHLFEVGKYRVKFVTSSSDNEDEPGRWEVLLINPRGNSTTTLGQGDVPMGEMQEAVWDLSISGHRLGRVLECRVHYAGKGTLQLHYIEVTRIE